MKIIALISLLIFFIFSCSKTEDLLTVDCSHSFGSSPPVTCNGYICQTDTCTTYSGIWKELFKSKNNMTEEYFKSHITICNTGTYKYDNQGIQFELAYKFSVDWFEVKFEEGFMIWLLPSYLQNNPTVNLPANTLLSKDQIAANIDNPFFSEQINLISPIDHLYYPSRQEAITVMAHAAGVNDMCESNLYIEYEDVKNPQPGNPVLTASGTLSWEGNSCVAGIMDLATGFLQVQKNACMISFCFTGGTKIIQDINSTKSIEKISPGDKILSYNVKTGNIEDDIVKKVDSVRHNDIVHILFTDQTKNDNTYDHPYYVKNKGWCSYKPLLTQQKYNLQTKQLLPGDTCFKYKDNHLIEVGIKNITENPGDVMTYNISALEKNNTYFANGILVSTENN